MGSLVAECALGDYVAGNRYQTMGVNHAGMSSLTRAKRGPKAQGLCCNHEVSA